MHELQEALERVRRRIANACDRVRRDSSGVTLIAATKAVPAHVIGDARDLGITDFAENYVKELRDKAPSVPARWHFVGKLQSGTARHVAELADVVHSAEGGRVLAGLADRAHRLGRLVGCLVQVDFAGHRQGVDPSQLAAVLEETSALRGVQLCGLMTLPPVTADPDGARPFFRRLRELRDDALATWPQLTELSMGMSADYAIAVEEGATMVRVGTALFGKRPLTQTT